jgi:hypothetical protein
MIPYAVSIKYMIAGYTAIFTIQIVYLVSLVMRWRRLKRDIKMLDDLSQKPK